MKEKIQKSEALAKDNLAEQGYMSRQIPEWWSQYKKQNPSDKDEYDPNKHCCQRFWKDWCDCMKK